uniref:Uncharacterized protein n=1 Tax=Physcomitrium patens TaxID=3218 RepID=A0A7I4BEM9_PHYPA
MTCLTIPSSTSHAEWRIHHMKYRSQLRALLEPCNGPILLGMRWHLHGAAEPSLSSAAVEPMSSVPPSHALHLLHAYDSSHGASVAGAGDITSIELVPILEDCTFLRGVFFF